MTKRIAYLKYKESITMKISTMMDKLSTLFTEMALMLCFRYAMRSYLTYKDKDTLKHGEKRV